MLENIITPLANYMVEHQNMGALIAGLIACAESMAIIGTIIPGSITMTLIGTLIGSGVLAVGLTLSYIVVGAFIGDYLSYWVGAHYKEKIKDFKIIQRYITWIEYGEKFITKHGVKSIIIGRFFGPMRSMVPLVAGVLGMSRIKFILGATPSVILWAALYLTPGIILGAFALEMPTDVAMQFIAIIIGFIVAIICISWLCQKIIKYLTLNQNYFANKLWQKIMTEPGWLTINFFHCNKMGPIQILKSIYAAILFIISVIILITILYSNVLTTYDIDTLNLMQNTYSQSIYKAMTLVTFLGDKFVIIPTTLIVMLFLFWQKESRLLKHLASLTITTSVLIELMKYSVLRPRPILSSVFTELHSFPSGHMALSTAILTFAALVLCHHLKPHRRSIAYKSIALLLLIIGYSRLYTYAHWLSDVTFGMTLGLTIAIVSSLLYHRKPCKINHKAIIVVASISYLIFYALYATFNYNRYIASYEPPYHPIYHIKKDAWWGGNNKVGHFRENKIGKPMYPLNIQWLGDKEKIATFLKLQKWKTHTPQESIISRAVHLIDEPSLHVLPLIPQTYKGNNTALIFSYKKSDNEEIIIKLWPSYIKIGTGAIPLWLGSIYKNKIPERLFPIHSKYNPKMLNTTGDMQHYSKQLLVNVIDLTSTYNTKDSLPSNLQYSGWDKKIIQSQFSNDQKDKK